MAECCEQCERNKQVLGKLITWMGQTQGSPISLFEASLFLGELEPQPSVSAPSSETGEK